MSDIRSPWHHHPRAFLTEAQAAKLFLERNGCCWNCGKKLYPGDDWTVGHKLALELGGTNDWENLAPECETCKPKVDAKDHSKAGHSRRVATRHVLPKSLKDRSSLSKRPGMKYDWRQKRYVRVSREDEA